MTMVLSGIIFHLSLQITSIISFGMNLYFIGGLLFTIFQVIWKWKDYLPNIRLFFNFYLVMGIGFVLWQILIFLIQMSNLEQAFRFPYVQTILIIGVVSTNCILKWWREPRKIPEIPLKKPKKKDFGKGSLPIGTIFHDKQIQHKFNLDQEDLKRHILIYGQTGTGKTSFVKHLLVQFKRQNPQIPLLLFEFKGEYCDLSENIPHLRVIQPGVNFAFNLFDHDIFNSKIYVEILFDSLKSCRILEDNSDFSPQMEKVLIDVLHEVCDSPKNQSWTQFNRILEKYVMKNQNKIPLLAQTMISLKNRLRRYMEGPLGQIFNFSANASKISQLLQMDCVVDLSSVLKLGGNKEDLIFLANIILKWVWESNMQKPATNQLRHLTIFEDASYLSSRKLLESSKLSSYLEDIALLLRGKGEALISITTTLDISRNIIMNAGSKFFFKFNEKPEELIHFLGLPQDFYLNVNELTIGFCLAKMDSIPYVFLLKTPRFKKMKNFKPFSNHLSQNPSKKKTKKDAKGKTHIPLLKAQKKHQIVSVISKQTKGYQSSRNSSKRHSSIEKMSLEQIEQKIKTHLQQMENSYLTDDVLEMKRHFQVILDLTQNYSENLEKKPSTIDSALQKVLQMRSSLKHKKIYPRNRGDYLESLWVIQKFWKSHIWKVISQNRLNSEVEKIHYNSSQKSTIQSQDQIKIKEDTQFDSQKENRNVMVEIDDLSEKMNQHDSNHEKKKVPSLSIFSLAMFRFNDITGPELYYKFGKTHLSSHLIEEFGRYLDRFTDKFELTVENIYCRVYFIEISSEWSRSKKELLELIIFAENSNNLQQKLLKLEIDQRMEHLIKEIQRNPTRFKSFYLQDRKKMETQRSIIISQSKQLKHALQVFLCQLNEDALKSESINTVLSKTQKQLIHLQKLNQYVQVLLQNER